LALNSAEYRFLFPVIGFVLSSGRTKLSCLSGFRGPPQYTAEHLAERRYFADLLREMKGFIDEVDGVE
jgi:hypothetical protein